METVDLAYEELGTENTNSLLILHGFFASSRNWRAISDKLAINYHVFVPDMRNHGRSPHHNQMDYPSMAADVLAFMHKHNLNSVNLMGHSMGGKIAMWLALHYPEIINKMIIVDIAPKRYDHSFDKILYALANLPLAELQNRKQAEALLTESISQQEYRQFLLQNLVLANGKYQWRIDLSIYLKTAHHIASFPETASLLPFGREALFLAGAESSYVNPNDMQTLFPNSQYRSIEDAGHWLHVQKPEVFLQEVESFLQRGG